MGAQPEHLWDGPLLSAGIVTGVIWFGTTLFGGGLQRSAGPDDPAPTQLQQRLPTTAPTTGWPAPTSAPSDDVLVPWRLLAPRYATIPSATQSEGRFAVVEGELAHGDQGTAVITLTARGRDVSLDPCPDYLYRWQGTQTRRGLDCAGVPFRDARGAPYLPRDEPVRFEIALRLDIWELAAPDGVVLQY